MTTEKKIPADATFTVQAEWTCPHCKGEKIISHPVWEAFWKEKGEAWKKATAARQEPGNPEGDEIIDAFMREHGYGSLEQHPPEEIGCESCAETGRMGRRVSLEDALRRSPLIKKIAALGPTTLEWEEV